MKIKFSKLLVLLFLLVMAKQTSFAQVAVPNYTSCPGQTITATATWNNTGSITYSLYSPPVGSPPTVFTGATFPISQVGSQTAVTVAIYTLTGIGNNGTNTVTSTTNFSLTVIPPPAMTFTNSQIFCYGSTATFVAQNGGSVYNYTGSGLSGSSTSNFISLPNVQSSNSGNITVVSVINGCTVTGVTNIQVSPLKTLAVSNATSVCQGAGVTLTASLPGGTNYQWLFNSSLLPTQSPPSTYAMTGVTIANSGTYTVRADDQFNGIFCPYTATTVVNVVQTNPIVATASPSNVVCQGTNLNLTASAANATGWQWNGPSFTSALANPVLTSVSPVNSGAYSVTATFQGAFLACTTTAAISVSVVPVSQPVISMPASVCQDGSITVTGSAGSSPISYNWAGPLFTGTVATTGSAVTVPQVPVNASGTQFLTVKFAFPSIPNVQCAATASAQLNVVPVNTVSVVPPGNVCSPTNAFLQALATGATQYLWSGPNNYTNQGPNVWVYYPTPAASGIYTVTAYFTAGNLICSNMNTVQLNVYPELTFSLIPRQQVCYNSSVSISGPSGASSYTWTSSTGFTSNNQTITFPSAQPNNSGTYTLNVSLGPCQSSGSSELVVLTPISFTLTPFDRTICRGDTIYLQGGATGGSENYAFVWNPSVFLQSSTGSSQMAVPLGSVLYNLTVHDIACPNYTISHAFHVDVTQPPIPNLQLAKGEGCVPLVLDINPKLSVPSAITTYDFGGKRIFQHNDTLHPGFTYTLDTPGTYTLMIYTDGYTGCSNTFQYPYPITVYPKPGGDFHWEPETPTTNDELTFYSTYSSGPISYYSWSFLGGVTQGDTTMHNAPGLSDTTNAANPKRSYTSIGEYPVVWIAENQQGCIDTVYKVVKVIDDLQLYIPNSFTPNGDGINDVFMPKGTGMKTENYSMDIFNRAGLNVFSTRDVNQGWDGKVGGQVVKDATYIYKIKVVGMNGEGQKEITGYLTLLK